MKHRAGGIIVKDGKVLLIYRYRPEKGQYYVVPGGKNDKGETIEEAAVRELKEETNLDVVLGKKLYELENTSGKHRIGHYFEILEFSGEEKMIGEESRQNSPDNIFRLEWIPIEKVSEINLVPPGHKEYLVKYYSE